jgi:diguanylate cyclase (GGDEF)-like protein
MQVDGEIASGSPPFAVAVCDVNGLKHVNDTLGHKAGDAYIRAASAMICEIFKHSPVYRIGGDEFAVYLTGRDYERRAELMQQLHDRSAANIAGGEVVVAGGLSDFRPGEDRDIHTVFARADGRMYEEKAALKALGARTR